MSSSSTGITTSAAAPSSSITLKTPHILVFPHPAQGHILALLELTHQLLLRDLAITILVTPKNLPILNPLLQAHPSVKTLVLPFPDHPSVPPGVEHVKDIGNHGNIPIVAALSKLQEPIIEWFKTHQNPPTAIISDFFHGWTHYLAQELNIPRFAFFSTASFLSCVNTYLWRDLDVCGKKPMEGEMVEFPDLPRSPSFKEEHLPSAFRFYKESDRDWDVFKRAYLANLWRRGCIFNSFHTLEKEYLDHMNKELPNGRVYGVGPLSFIGGSGVLSRANPDPDTRCKCNVSQWLDACPVGSVLYVSFGSQKLLTEQQIEALALGLEQSSTRFVWVLNPGTSKQASKGNGTVPDGFEERVAGRGLVIKGWAPQIGILNHEAVGGFLSHCGWNSVLETVVAGVMILAWPMEADQFINARLLVEYMGVAVRVCEGANTVPDSNVLADNIRKVMKDDIPEMKKAKELKDKAIEAVTVRGSSIRQLDDLVTDLTRF